MIVDGILSVLSIVFSVILSPLEIINVGVDVVTSIPVISNFITVIAYIFPWNNILPIILLTFLIVNFKNLVAFIMAVWRLLPFA